MNESEFLLADDMHAISRVGKEALENRTCIPKKDPFGMSALFRRKYLIKTMEPPLSLR